MTSYELEFQCTVMKSLKAIAKELKKSNELRAVELRLRYNPGESVFSVRNQVDEIMQEDE